MFFLKSNNFADKCFLCGKGEKLFCMQEQQPALWKQSVALCKTNAKTYFPVITYSNIYSIPHKIDFNWSHHSSVPNLQDSDLLVITILDENDNRPVFTRASYRAEITENTAAGSAQPVSFPLTGGQSVTAAQSTVPEHCLWHCLSHFLTYLHTAFCTDFVVTFVRSEVWQCCIFKSTCSHCAQSVTKDTQQQYIVSVWSLLHIEILNLFNFLQDYSESNSLNL